MSYINDHLKDLRRFIAQDTFTFTLTTLLFFLIAVIFLYLYFALETSPALIWPPVGLALAMMILGGYRMWLPIFLGLFAAMLIVSSGSLFTMFAISAGYALQAIGGLYVLRQFNFENDLGKLRNMLIFVCVALGVTCIAPLVSTAGQMLAGTLSVDPSLSLFRAWGAGIFSMFIVTPLILFWYPFNKGRFAEDAFHKFEIAIATLFLLAANHFVFWTTLPQYIGIVVIFVLPAVLIWFALRLHPRWLAFAVTLTAIQSVAGAIYASPSNNPLNEQLLAIEIYVGLVAAIFYVFVAVVEERRSAFARLSEAYEITRASEKSKNEFIAILAHELRNPLAPVISSLELLRSQENDPQKNEMIESTLEHTVMMRRLLDDLLDIARLEQSKIVLHRETASIKKLVHQALPSVNEKAKSIGHTVQVSLPEEDFDLYVDPVRIKQIIINLLNNALKYTKVGGKIQLFCIKEGNEAVIRVTDTGIGIAPEKITHIFEPFKQLGSSSRYSSGLGIGLFLTRKLTELHGGRIQVESLGATRGSTFTVHIPIIVPPHTHIATEQVPIAADKTSTNVQKILIVDDNKTAADILCKLLSLHKYEAKVAYSGKEAIAIASSFVPDAILLDIGMPDMDGYATAKALRALPWSGLIIALSGYGQPSDKSQSKEAGFDDHLVKPVGIEEIVAALSGKRRTSS